MWQNLPQYVSPIAFSLGPVEIYWYALMWLSAFAVCACLLYLRLRKGEGDAYGLSEEFHHGVPARAFISDLFFNTLLGALLGGRIGYVLFYDFSYFLQSPLSIISPYNFTTEAWTGIMGMSYHGGAIGVVIAFFITARAYGVPVLKLADFVAPVVGAGYVFGRLGNFFNGELVGRVTTVPWGMYFPGYEGSLRHASQLYEALGEGILIFVVMWTLRNRRLGTGFLSGLYLLLYGVVRFVVEFYREPDEHIGLLFLSLSMGQILSSAMIIIGGVIIFVSYRKGHK